MLEEWVGAIWHRFITDKANQQYPEARVELDAIRYRLGVFFRALGGEGGLRIEQALEAEVHAKRTRLQRLAGTGKKVQYAWRDDETLRLPESLAVFPTPALNFDLYLWLVALSTMDVDKGDWISRNQQRTQAVFSYWPGLQVQYQRLLSAYLPLRPDPQTLPEREAEQERIIQAALRDPAYQARLDYAKRPPQPVLLWLHPCPPEQAARTFQTYHGPDQEDLTHNETAAHKTAKRKQGQRDDAPEGQQGLISFRLESLWSWAEFSKVDRTSTDDNDDDLSRTAEDLDTITLAQDAQQSTAGKIKLDLDLPATHYDDHVIATGITVDEWDYKSRHLQADYCRIIPMMARDAFPCPLPARLQVQARKIRRQFEVLRPQRQWQRRQYEGSEIDLDSYLHILTQRKQGHRYEEQAVYRALRQDSRDLSCLLLADLSLSTDAYINNVSRVVDVIRDALYLFAEALSVTGDRFALYGFSSRHRHHVRFYQIKTFDAPYNDTVRGFIGAIKPGYYTRMGAAIRYATQKLEAETPTQKLLLLLTDGKPNDIDKYEGRYGLEDTRQAIIEAQQKGIQPFCITIDDEAEDYLPYLFGKNAFVSIHKISELPIKLPQLYLRLTQ